MLLKVKDGEISSRRLKRAVQDQIRQALLSLATDDLTLLEVVGRGEFEFRGRFLRAFPKGAVDETIANQAFAFLCGQVVRRFGRTPVAKLLDALEVHVERPPTQAEIDDAWEFTSGSSQEARRLFDLPTGTYRKDPGGTA